MSALTLSLLGLRLRVLHPLWLLACPLALGLAALWALGLWRRERALRRIGGARADQLLWGSNAWLGTVRAVLVGLAVALFAAAAARVQVGTRVRPVKRTGADLVIALDASRSMEARDVLPTREARAKAEIGALIDRLGGDRVGLIAFAGEAFVQCPLTTDYGAAQLLLQAIEPESMPQQGTSLADALGQADELLSQGARGGTGRAILLVSDGEDQEGGAQTVAARLAAKGIRVDAVVVGSTQGEPIPILDKGGRTVGYKKDALGNVVLTRAEPELLTRIARAGGGRVLPATGNTLGIPSMLGELDRMQKGELESRIAVDYEDRAGPLGWPAAVLLLLSFALAPGLVARIWSTVRRRRRKGRGPAAEAASLAAGLLLIASLGPAGHAGPLARQGLSPRVPAAWAPEWLRPLFAQPSGLGTDAAARLAAGDAETAARLYAQVAPSAPQAAQAQQLDLGTALLASGDAGGATKPLVAAARGPDPALAERATFAAALIKESQRDEEGAAALYRTALLADPADQDARTNLELLLRRKQTEQGPGAVGAPTKDAHSQAPKPQPPPPEPPKGQGDQGQKPPESKPAPKPGSQPPTPDPASQQGPADQQSGEVPPKPEGSPQGPGAEPAPEAKPTPDAQSPPRPTQAPPSPSPGQNRPEAASGQPQPGQGQEGDKPLGRDEAQRLLDSLRASERNLQGWRFGTEKKRWRARESERDW